MHAAPSLAPSTDAGAGTSGSKALRVAALLLLGVGMPAWAAGEGSAPARVASVPSSAVAAPPHAKSAAETPGEPAGDPIERLRQRLAERLAERLSDRTGERATVGAAPAGGPASELRLSARLPSASTTPGASGTSGTSRASATSRTSGTSGTSGTPGTPGTSVGAGSARSSPSSTAAAVAAAPGAGPGMGARAARGQAGRRAVPGAGDAAADWGYEGAAGPAAWGSLRPEFSLCAQGLRQSPIDIREGLPVALEPVRFDYRPSRFSVIDTGRTVQVNLAPGNSIEVGGRRFELVELRFRRPSEERIDGRQFAMSAHLLHRDAQGRTLVVAVLVDPGPARAAMQTAWANLPLERNEEVAARAVLDLADLLPEDRRYYTYMGSLTTPPCSEGVQWVVMRAPVTASPEQIEVFARLYPMNARPLQALAGRRILQSE
jgi:carbonic anhydrase